MSEAAATVEIGGEAAAPKKSKKMLIIIIVVVVVLLAAGGGGGYWYWSKKKAEEAAALEAEKGKKGAKGKAAAHDDEHGDEHADEEEEEAADEEHAEEDAPKKTASRTAVFRMPDDSKVKEVIELQPFIINLADPGEIRYLRLTASVGIGGDEEGGEHKVDPLLTTRIRNAMLAVLTTRTSEEVLTVEGKAKLRTDLLRGARKAAKEAHIEAVYITEFIVQM
jgi:flagellar protein FliL